MPVFNHNMLPHFKSVSCMIWCLACGPQDLTSHSHFIRFRGIRSLLRRAYPSSMTLRRNSCAPEPYSMNTISPADSISNLIRVVDSACKLNRISSRSLPTRVTGDVGMEHCLTASTSSLRPLPSEAQLDRSSPNKDSRGLVMQYWASAQETGQLKVAEELHWIRSSSGQDHCFNHSESLDATTEPLARIESESKSSTKADIAGARLPSKILQSGINNLTDATGMIDVGDRAEVSVFPREEDGNAGIIGVANNPDGNTSFKMHRVELKGTNDPNPNDSKDEGDETGDCGLQEVDGMMHAIYRFDHTRVTVDCVAHLACATLLLAENTQLNGYHYHTQANMR